MEITCIGHSCFKIKGKNATIVIDPYDPKKMGYKLPKLEADIVLSTHDHFDHNYKQGVTGYKHFINAPGEYEASEIFIYAIKTFHDEKKGAERGENIMYLIEVDEFEILHVGDLGHDLSDSDLEKASIVDVLLVPVGGTYTIGPKRAAQVVSKVEPGIVIPMHYQTKDLTGLGKELAPLDKFLNEMGVKGDNGHRQEEKLKLSSRNDIPEETEVIVLTPQH